MLRLFWLAIILAAAPLCCGFDGGCGGLHWGLFATTPVPRIAPATEPNAPRQGTTP